jgi:riboflavin biosynthesis pyrimidine reductase
LERRIDALFGPGIDWRRETGVVHVAAIGESPRAALAIGPDAPRSAVDRFVLGFARARADVIVTTGAILRAEPDLIHRTAETPDEAAAWAHWRRERLGRVDAPRLCVLSASGAVDLAHPALRAGTRTIVWTTAAGRERLGPVDLERVEVVVPPADPTGAPSPPDGADAGADAPAQAALEAALRWLRGGAGPVGVGTIVIEAGPRATAGLYASARSARAVDELLLGIYAGGRFPAVAGPTLPDTDRLAHCFSSLAPSGALAAVGGERRTRAAGVAVPRSRVWVEEPSGPWRFERYRRTLAA